MVERDVTAFRAAIFLIFLQSMEKYRFFLILALRVTTVYSNYENAIKTLKL